MKEEENNIIQIDDFMKVDLRVARIEEASHVEGADKLLAIKLDLGDLGTKNVFAGIKSVYENVTILFVTLKKIFQVLLLKFMRIIYI